MNKQEAIKMQVKSDGEDIKEQLRFLDMDFEVY